MGACTVQLILESLCPSETKGKTRQAFLYLFYFNLYFYLFFYLFFLPARKKPCAYHPKTAWKLYANKSPNLDATSSSHHGLPTCQENHRGRVGGMVACTWKWQHRIENTCSQTPLIYAHARAGHVRLHCVFQKEVIFHLIRDAQPTENMLLYFLKNGCGP